MGQTAQIQTRTLTSESELSSSASVGALSNFFLCESGCAPLAGFGEGGVSSANASVLTAIFFLGVPGVSVQDMTGPNQTQDKDAVVANYI